MQESCALVAGLPVTPDPPLPGRQGEPEVPAGACPNCGHENPPHVAHGLCEICDAHWYRHGYDTRTEYLRDLETERA